MPIDAIIFDFDGVIADSEVVANHVLAEWVAGLGLPTTLAQSIERYMGKRWPDVMAAIEAGVGRPLPPGFSDAVKAATLRRFETDLREIEGAAAFIARFATLKRAIASSSSQDRLHHCLGILGLAELFGTAVFSADRVARGKPAPDIFLFAADQLGVSPAACLVIEDSANGVAAGVAAGMTVIGFCAGAHVREGHAAALSQAGAAHIATSWDEAAGIVQRLHDGDASSSPARRYRRVRRNNSAGVSP